MASYSYVDPNGEQITVATRGDGGAVTECSNGTTTVHNPDGSSRSVNDPLGGAPVVVEIAPTGDTVITYPNGSSEVVRQDGWVTHTDPDGTSVTTHPGLGPSDADQTFWKEHPATRTAPGGVPTVGATLQGAVALGHIQDVVVISTGQNVGTVAVVECTSDGAVPFVYVPSSVLTPGDTVENQRLATHPMVIDTATPGPVSAEIPGVCRQEPFKPPADSGDTDLTLNVPPEGDLTPSIPAIVDGVVGKGVVPADLLGSPQDTALALTQVTTWLYNGATPEEVTRFLIPRFPSTMSDRDRQDTATELTGWGRRLVDKTNNLGKQKAVRPPEVPPVLFDNISDTSGVGPAGATTADGQKGAADRSKTSGTAKAAQDTAAAGGAATQDKPPKGAKVATLPDGTRITDFPDGTRETRYPDGRRKYEQPQYRAEGRGFIEECPDGHVVVYPDWPAKYLPDLTPKPSETIYPEPDGRRVLEYQDGSKLTKLPDGKEYVEPAPATTLEDTFKDVAESDAAKHAGPNWLSGPPPGGDAFVDTGHYDDGHAFGWPTGTAGQQTTATPAPTEGAPPRAPDPHLKP